MLFATFIEGNPQPQPRPRARVVTKRGRSPFPAIYSPKTVWRATVEKVIQQQWVTDPLSCPLELYLRFILPRMKTVRREYPTSQREGDVDNLAKAVMDGLNKVLYVDDGQVVDLHVTKHYPTGDQKCGVHIKVLESTDPLRNLKY